MADITVQVSSAGLTAYGSQSWGSLSYGGDQSPNVTVLTPDAFNNSGWGGQTWNFGSWGDLVNAEANVSGFGLNLSLNPPAAYPEQGWGGKQWGANLWGDLINNEVIPSSLTLNVSVGSESVDGEINTGWGRNTWGSNIWNGYGNVIPSSLSIASTVESVTINGEINSGWGGEAWGENAWGIFGDVLASGNQLSISSEHNQDAWGDATWSDYNTRWGGVGSVDVGIFNDAPITQAQELNTTVNSVDVSIATEIFLSENPLNTLSISEGTVDPAPDVMPSGVTLATSLGTIQAYNEQGWGRDDWGTEVWGAEGEWVYVDVTSPGALSIDSGIRETWGQDEWGADTTEWGGVSITDVDVSVNVPVSTEFTPGWGAEIGWGQQEWGQATVDMSMTSGEGTVDPAPDTDITGVQLNTTVNAVSITADANIVLNNDILPTFTAEADAQLSTAQAKFGPSSLLLDGTGDFVQSTNSPEVVNNFTIEFFAYASDFAQNAYLWDNSLSNQGFAFSLTSAGQLRLIQNNTIIAQTSSPTLINNQWNHFALEQNGSLLNLYINGNRRLQYATGGDSYPGQPYKIGTNEGETQFFNGYIDEFRSSNIARYTDNFTPPTSAFTVDGNTISLLHFDGANGSTDIINETGSEIPRIELGLNQGNAEAVPNTIASVTGIQFGPFTIGDYQPGINGEAYPTGVTTTTSTGIIGLNAWELVDPGTSPTWTVVDKAA